MRSPRGVPLPGTFDQIPTADVFSASQPSPKGQPEASIPLSGLVRKLVSMRLKLLWRRLLSSRPGARRRAVLALFGMLACMCLAWTLFASVPHDSHDLANLHAELSDHSPVHSRIAPAVHHDILPPAPPAGIARGGGDVEAHRHEDLRRRAEQLSHDISEFKAQESAASKQRQLRLTAQQLNSELAQLKQMKVKHPAAHACR